MANKRFSWSSGAGDTNPKWGAEPKSLSGGSVYFFHGLCCLYPCTSQNIQMQIVYRTVAGRPLLKFRKHIQTWCTLTPFTLPTNGKPERQVHLQTTRYHPRLLLHSLTQHVSQNTVLVSIQCLNQFRCLPSDACGSWRHSPKTMTSSLYILHITCCQPIMISNTLQATFIAVKSCS